MATLNATETARPLIHGDVESRLATWLVAGGTGMLRYGLVFLLLLIGGMKFFEFEAEGIKPFVENSPLMSWLYRATDTRTASAAIGLSELVIAVMIGLRPVSRRISGYGSLAAIGMVTVHCHSRWRS